jgi:hypothetical protein
LCCGSVVGFRFANNRETHDEMTESAEKAESLITNGAIPAFAPGASERVSAGYAWLKAVPAVANHSSGRKVAFTARTAFPPLPQTRRFRSFVFRFGPRRCLVGPYDSTLRVNSALRIRSDSANRAYRAVRLDEFRLGMIHSAPRQRNSGRGSKRGRTPRMPGDFIVVHHGQCCNNRL